ncbi:MAG: 3D domain-containing protein [Phycisphaerales bacterium]|nr:3D domain-containing protein [Phycisphaerales bacterium]
MRRSRGLTKGEQRELGMFMGILVVGCLCLAGILNFRGVPFLAAASTSETASSSAQPFTTPLPVQDEPPAPVTLILPPPPPMQPTSPLATIAPPPSPPVPKPLSASDVIHYKGQQYRHVRTLRLRVTAYAPDPRCCYPYPGTTTATGFSVKTNGGNLVAADPRLIPMHSLVVVPGYGDGAAVPVLDTGGKIKGHRLDVLLPNFQTAKSWGTRILDVKIYEPVN